MHCYAVHPSNILLFDRSQIYAQRENLCKVVQNLGDMTWFRGKCASCGVSANHKNFNGRRSGYKIPNPCFVELRNRRPAKDNRICVKCYNKHCTNTPAVAASPSVPSVQRRRSYTSSLDGVHWSEPMSERVAKKSRKLENGEEVIPLSLHEEKMAEQARAHRVELETHWNRLADQKQEQEECDGVEAIFLRE